MTRVPPPSQKAIRLLAVIAGEIERGEIRENRPWTFLSDSTALERLGVQKPKFRPGRRLQQHGLDDLNEWTREFPTLPKIAALIVEQKTMRPNPQFAASHGVNTHGTAWLDWWIDQANRSIHYDWSPFLGDAVAENVPAVGTWPIVAEDGGADIRYLDFIELERGPRGTEAFVRGTGIAVQQVLAWLASGQTESDILQQHPSLHREQIQASLAFAAEQVGRPAGLPVRKPTFAQRWKGRFELPDPDPSDPRLTYLLEKYTRHRQ